MQVVDKRFDLVFTQRIAERGHVFAAIVDLVSYFIGLQFFAHPAQVGPGVAAAEAGRPVTVSTAFVGEQRGALHFSLIAGMHRLRAKNQGPAANESDGEILRSEYHACLTAW